MSLCVLCGPVSQNPIDFQVCYGALDRWLQVCRWCLEDLELLGFRHHGVVRLPKVRVPPLSLLEVFGPVYGLILAGWKGIAD